jgi:hypothetical protein
LELAYKEIDIKDKKNIETFKKYYPDIKNIEENINENSSPFNSNGQKKVFILLTLLEIIIIKMI